MATRKQRARRAKAMRHEYGFVTYDDEGNEVEVDPSELRAEKEKGKERGKGKEASAPSKGRGGSKQQAGRRRTAEPLPPSWNRALRRGGIWGAATIAASVLLLRGTSVPVRVLIGAVYAALFIPMTYWLDGVIYRRHERRKTSDGRSGSARRR